MKIKRIKIAPLCECQCGGHVEWSANKNGWNKYILFHHWRNRKHTAESLSKMSGENHPNFGKKCPEQSKRMKENSPLYGVDRSGKNNPMYGVDRHGSKNPMYGKGYLLIGDKNPNWKGGISCEPYCDVWLDQEYKQSIKDRDNNICQNPDCWGTTDILVVHHIDYNKKNCVPKNLLTLCNSCNCRANGNRPFWTELYQGIIEQKYERNNKPQRIKINEPQRGHGAAAF